MRLLAAHQIRPELLDMICSAQKYVVFVFPSLKLSSPARLTLSANLDIHPHPVDGLQAAFCYTEAGGLISSFNLLGTPPGIAIHIGCKLELATELKELKGYVQQYIKSSELMPSDQPALSLKSQGYLNPEMFALDLKEYISQYTGWPVAVSALKGDYYRMQINGQQFDVQNEKVTRQMVLYTHLVGAEIAEYNERGDEFFSKTHFEYHISLNGDGSDSLLAGVYNVSLSRANPTRLPDKEKFKMLHAFVMFIKSTQAFREAVSTPAHKADDFSCTRQLAWE
jgi:hypothetical protein